MESWYSLENPRIADGPIVTRSVGLDVVPATLARSASKGILGKNACLKRPSLARRASVCGKNDAGARSKSVSEAMRLVLVYASGHDGKRQTAPLPRTVWAYPLPDHSRRLARTFKIIPDSVSRASLLLQVTRWGKVGRRVHTPDARCMSHRDCSPSRHFSADIGAGSAQTWEAPPEGGSVTRWRALFRS
jgi:hypothetical protein